MRWVLSMIAAVSIAGLIALVVATSARAGTYVIDNCPASRSGDFTVGPWTQFGSLTAPGSFKQTCATPNDSFGIASNGIPSNGTSGEYLQTPSSITMQHIKLWWEAPAPVSGGGWSYALVDVYSPGWSRVFQSTTPMSADGAGRTAPTEISLPTNTSQLNVEIYCTTSQNCTYNENPLQISGSELTLADTGLPTGVVTGGGLAGAGPVSGTQSLAYRVEDSGSGVRLVELLVGGQSVAKNDYLAECPYANFAACPTTISSLISWNTADVSDGSHEVALRIVNAAGNAVIVDDHTVTVGNASSGGSGGSSGSNGVNGASGPSGTPGAGGSSGADVTVNVSGSGSGSNLGSVLSGNDAKWRVSLKVAPLRVQRHTKINLSGSVSTSPRPSGGKLIYLQARSVSTAWKGRGSKRHRVTVFGRWVTFQAFRAKGNGSFASTYTFKLGGRHTYQFQAVAPAEGQYRNPTGTSSTITVKEL